MFKKIDKLQSEINELLEACEDAGAIDDSLDIKSLPEDKQRERLGVMILKYQDGALEPESVKKLEQCLNADEKYLRYFVDFQTITSLLYAYYNKGKFEKFVDYIKNMVQGKIFAPNR